MPKRINEDALTERLAENLRHHEFQDVYLRFLLGEACSQQLRDLLPLQVNTQHRFSEDCRSLVRVGSRGRLDLMLTGWQSSESIAIGVEHKVWDEEKPSRLHNYRLLIEGEGHRRYWLFEFVREKDYEVEQEGLVDRVFLWRDFHAYLSRVSETANLELKRSCISVCQAIYESGALVEGKIVRGRQLCTQVGSDGEALLDCVLERSTNFDAKKTRDKGIPLHLRIGRKSWTSQHPGRWHQRLWVFSHEVRPGDFGLIIQFIFHNANFTDLAYAESRLHEWAEPYSANGLKVYRGPERGWDGKKRVALEKPWRLDCKPKYFYTEEPLDLGCRVTSKKDGVDSVVNSAMQRVERYLAIFDNLGKQT